MLNEKRSNTTVTEGGRGGAIIIVTKAKSLEQCPPVSSSLVYSHLITSCTDIYNTISCLHLDSLDFVDKRARLSLTSEENSS